MKTENGNNELALRNKNSASSHYRINSGGFKVQLMAVTDESKKGGKNEFLMCQIGYRHEFVVASVGANETVKLFTLEDFIKYEYEERNIPAVTIPFEQYANPDTFLAVVAQHFFHLTTHKKQSLTQ